LTPIEQSFVELSSYIDQLDNDDGNSFLPVLQSLTPKQIAEKLHQIEQYSLQLGFEEAREMQRTRILDIFEANEHPVTKAVKTELI